MLYWIRLVLLFVVYGVTAKLGLQADAVGGFASLVWPATGIALTAIVLFGFSLWPAVALAAFAVNYSSGAPLLIAFVIGIGNALEALLGAYCLRWVRFQPSLTRVRDVAALVIFAGLLAPLVAATLGTTSLWLGNVVQPASFAATWSAWYLGDSIGIVIVAPLLLVWAKSLTLVGMRSWLLEATLLGVMLLGVCLAVFHRQTSSVQDPILRAYMVYPLLVWTALRFSPRGTATALFAISVCAIAGTARGLGPFEGASLQSSLLPLQIFMGVTAATMLMLVAAMAEMRSAVHARDEFLSVASHELNTPITSLKLQVQMMVRALQNEGPIPREKFVLLTRRVDEQLAQLARLVQTLLDVARISVGRLRLTLDDVDLGGLVQNVITYCEVENAGQLPVAFTARAPVVGRWDRLRLEQLVTNLVTNAVKYGDGKRIEITLVVEGDRAILSVLDHGIGIPASRLPFIFERFERAVPEGSYSGLGLGLYICRQIAEAHGGSIRVRSKPGEGSRFTVELPLPKLVE